MSAVSFGAHDAGLDSGWGLRKPGAGGEQSGVTADARLEADN
jgi:hypothetical protein